MVVAFATTRLVAELRRQGPKKNSLVDAPTSNQPTSAKTTWKGVNQVSRPQLFLRRAQAPTPFCSVPCNTTVSQHHHKQIKAGSTYEKPPFVHNPVLHWSATNPPVTQASEQVWCRRCGHTCTQCVWQKQRVARQQHLAFLLSFSASFTLQFFCVSLHFR